MSRHGDCEGGFCVVCAGDPHDFPGLPGECEACSRALWPDPDAWACAACEIKFCGGCGDPKTSYKMPDDATICGECSRVEHGS